MLIAILPAQALNMPLEVVRCPPPNLWGTEDEDAITGAISLSL